MDGINKDINPLKRKVPATDHTYSAAEGQGTTVGGPAGQPLAPGAEAEAGQGDFPQPPEQHQIDMFNLNNFMKDFKNDLTREMHSLRSGIDDLHQSVRASGVQIADLEERVQNTERVAKAASNLIAEVREEMENIREEWNQMQQDPGFRVISDQNEELKLVRAQLEKQEWYYRHYNIIIDGITETDNKEPRALYQKVKSFLANILGLLDMTFDITHRLGPKQENGTRRVIVKFFNLTDKQTVWDARIKLQANKDGTKSPYRLIMDKPKATKEREALAFRIVQAAQQSPNFHSAKFQYGKIWVEGTSYNFDELDLLPEELSPANISAPRTAMVIVFFSRNSFLTNHYLSRFSFRGVNYVSIEQYLARAAKTLHIALAFFLIIL